MTLRHLKIFITVVDLGSMTAASDALFITQPTVSQAISELENYYGVKLFDRLSRRLYITEMGKKLLSYARHMIALFDEMEHAMKNPDKNGLIKVGASITVSTYLLPKLVKAFSNRFPFIQVKAVSKNTKDIESLLIKNDIDFAVVEGALHTSDIISKAFMDDELVLVCGKSHPLYQAGRISLFELSKYPFIVREQGSGTRELFENAMAAHHIKWQCAWECNGSDCLKSAASNGIGIAVLSQQLVQDEVRSGALSIIQVDHLDLKREFCIIYHKNKYLTESMNAFFDLCDTFSNDYV